MSENIVITFLDGEKLTLDEDSFVTLIKNASILQGDKPGFYSQMIYQNYLLKENNAPVSAETNSPMVGIMGVLASSDFFTVSNGITTSSDIDSDDVVIYKTSSIKSISFK